MLKLKTKIKYLGLAILLAFTNTVAALEVGEVIPLQPFFGCTDKEDAKGIWDVIKNQGPEYAKEVTKQPSCVTYGRGVGIVTEIVDGPINLKVKGKYVDSWLVQMLGQDGKVYYVLLMMNPAYGKTST